MYISRESLRNEIIESLKSQGFRVNPHLRPMKSEKDTLRKIHAQKRHEHLALHKSFLLSHLKKAKEFAISGERLQPEEIKLRLIDATGDTPHSRLFFWWNLVWWSLPYDKPIGRQMRYLLWDEFHNAPFGLIGLQSPPLKSGIRDNYLGLNSENIDYWINQSMNAQRIGALPPYNMLLGGKMAGLSLVSNEVREDYAERYEQKRTLMEKRLIPNRLLFVTTTSAYGKSSVYERISFRGEKVSKFIGFTRGSGTFHISQPIYEKMLHFLNQHDVNIKRGYGTGPSRKLKLISRAMTLLQIPKFTFHNINRGFYFFSNVKNLNNVLQKNKRPIWYDRPFNELTEFWKQRWAIPRAARNDDWKQFNSDRFFRKVELQIKRL